MDLPDDSQLINEILHGNSEKAARELVSRFGGRLLGAASLLCGNPADAQDLLAETLQRAVRSAGKYRGESSLYFWLHGILLNQFRMMRRKQARSRLDFTGELPDIPDERAPDAGETLDRETRSALLAAAVQKLSEPLREVVVLRYYDEMGLADIARTLSIPLGTVKSRLFAATDALKKLLPKNL